MKMFEVGAKWLSGVCVCERGVDTKLQTGDTQFQISNHF